MPLDDEFSLLVHIEPLIDNARDTHKDDLDRHTVQIGEVAINLEAVIAACGHGHGKSQQHQ